MKKSKLEYAITRANEHALEAVGDEVMRGAEKTYQSVIGAFYKSYKPRVYKRKKEDGTLAATNMSDILPPVNIVNGTAIITFIVDPSYIEGNPYRAKKDWVFGRTYLEGIHGFTPQELNDWQDYKKRRDAVLNSQGGITSGEWHARVRRPKSMAPLDPPPAELMDKKLNTWWNSNKKRINELYYSEFARWYNGLIS